VTDLFGELGRDERGERIGLATRRVVMSGFAAIALLALLGVFGQRPHPSTANGPAATLRLDAPRAVRGGLYFQARMDITATQAVQHPRLVLGGGWLEGMQVNSIEPQPQSENSRQGKLELSYGSLQPGDVMRVWAQFQVDPTNVGRRSFAVELDDAETKLVRVDRDLTVLP
jgi:hypothetical protein